jgi:hypothetical protein
VHEAGDDGLVAGVLARVAQAIGDGERDVRASPPEDLDDPVSRKEAKSGLALDVLRDGRGREEDGGWLADVEVELVGRVVFGGPEVEEARESTDDEIDAADDRGHAHQGLYIERHDAATVPRTARTA